MQDDFQIVNHHIHHDANVGRSKRVTAGTSGVDVFRIANIGRHRGKCRIESLNVPYLKGHVFLPSQSNQVVRLFGSQRDRLFNQERYATTEQLHPN